MKRGEIARIMKQPAMMVEARELLKLAMGLVADGRGKEENKMQPEDGLYSPGEWLNGKVASDSMDFNEYSNWLDGLKVGDEVILRWTAGSGGHYRGKAKLVRVNAKSVAGELLEEVQSEWGPYPRGKVIVVPRSIMDRKFSFDINSPWPVGITRLTSKYASKIASGGINMSFEPIRYEQGIMKAYRVTMVIDGKLYRHEVSADKVDDLVGKLVPQVRGMIQDG